jgi:hypothetical protein
MTTLHLRTAISRSPLRCGLLFIPLALACFALPPTARALLPPPAPDGGYPGNNTAEGDGALFNLTTGNGNTAIGLQALNTNTTGGFNTAIGPLALFSNTTGSENTATGDSALNSNTTGSNNTATGAFALIRNTTAGNNTANGYGTLSFNTTGSGNTATGFNALDSNTTGGNNTANGSGALQHNTIGAGNAANGVNALSSNTRAGNNTANGAFALQHNTTGNNNTALGHGAGLNQTTGSNNVYIGAGINGVAAENNACYVASIFGQTVDPMTGTAVSVDTNGKLGTVLSARRFKHDIRPMDSASEAILALKPVTFHYKSDAKNTPCFGLIAEEVAAVNPDLIVRDKNGEILSVRYEAVNAMLLNEFLKEYRKVEELKKDFQATVAQEQKEIAALAATVKEQASQIQKVSDQLELSKSAPQTVTNP